MLNWLEKAGARVPAIGVPSASAEEDHHPAEWNLYTIARTAQGWRTSIDIRQWDKASASFNSVKKIELGAA
jgi:hypothetical protein